MSHGQEVRLSNDGLGSAMLFGISLLVAAAVVIVNWASNSPVRGDASAQLQRVEGRFFDSDSGRGVVPVSLQYRLERFDDPRSSDPLPIHVEADGSFELDDIPEGVVGVRLRAELPDGYLRLRPMAVRHGGREGLPIHTILLPAGERLQIPAIRAGTIRGSVLKSRSALPRGTLVWAYWEPVSPYDLGMHPESIVEPSGAFSLTRIPIGPDVHVSVVGLANSGLMAEESTARAGDMDVGIEVTQTTSLRGRIVGRAPGARVYAVARAPENVVWASRLGHGVELSAKGHFELNGLPPDRSYDVVVARDRTCYAIVDEVLSGTDDLQVRLSPLVELRGTVRRRSAGSEARVELFRALRGGRICATETVGGSFLFRVPAGTGWTLFAECEGMVAIADDVLPPVEHPELTLASGSALHAQVTGTGGPVFSIVGRGGWRHTRWIAAGDDLRIGPVPRGAYRVQLLSFARAKSHLYSALRMHIGLPEQSGAAEGLKTGRSDQRLTPQ